MVGSQKPGEEEVETGISLVANRLATLLYLGELQANPSPK